MARLATIDAWRLALPLARPYRLAFGPVERFDTLMVRIVLDDGRSGWGEATLLTGYTDETIDETWTQTLRILESLGGGPDADAALQAALAALDASHPFLTTAFHTADEMAAGSPLLQLAEPARVPLLGLLQGNDPAQLADEVEALLAAGHDTLKLKVGFDAARDAQTVADAQCAVAGRALLRLDANQGYGAAAACRFVQAIDPQGIELFEQPCAAGDWSSHRRVAELAGRRGLPLMLDESIYSMREIEQAASLGAAAFIKLKLMKFNSLAGLDAGLARVAALGLKAVLGNGVANELGCWMEACIAARRPGSAGEMNGFLKPRERLFADPLRFEAGAIELAPHWSPRIDTDRLAHGALAHAQCRLPGR